MTEALNLDEIKKIPEDEFKEMFQNWMYQKEITQNYTRKLRKELVVDFQKTELAKRLEKEKRKNQFNPKEYVVDSLQAEHLYNQSNHLTLSVLFTETRHASILPNFEKEDNFRFKKEEIQDLVELLGIGKTDKIARRIQNVYKTSNSSLLSVILKELVQNHNSVETRNVGIQTEIVQQPLDNSVREASLKRSKKSKRGKNHGLVSLEFKARKPKKVKDVTVIAQNLEKMSSNINVITHKLDDLKHNPNSDESKSIIGHVGSIMSQLNGCIGNFESICRDIKQINEPRHRNYEDWMDDLKNSENGRRFLKKLQKSFARVMNDEKSKVQRECRKKLEREKSKLANLYRRKSVKQKEEKDENTPHPIVNEISEIFQTTCQKIQNMEKQDEIFLQSLDLDYAAKETIKQTKLSPNNKSPEINACVDLNKCRKLHSENSSEATYSSKSFESDIKSGENN